MAEPSARSVLDRVQKEHVRFINLQFTDVLGVVKSVTIPASQLEDCITHGKWFDGSSIEGFARIAESDMYLMPDLSTFAVIPWERGENTTARIICNIYTPDGQVFEGDPRRVLARNQEEAARLGFGMYTGPELEFFLLRRDEKGTELPLPHDRGGYFDLSTDLAMDVRKEMVNALEEIGIPVETSHHEVAIGQHEIDFQYAQALRTADNAVTFKYTLKSVALLHDLHATFMPKPIFGINGSGMHTHLSLFDPKSGDNLFIDRSEEYGLSRIARQFIAGLLLHARGMCAVLAPLVNSYKRLVPGFEAPVYIGWARVNRSALIRVPQISPGRPESTRIELRCPDASCNPYLAFAVMLACGLDGIQQELEPPPAVEENLYHFDEFQRAQRNVGTLPASLGEALDDLEGDDVVRHALGDHVYDRFLEAKRAEWDEYRAQITQWELERYLPIY